MRHCARPYPHRSSRALAQSSIVIELADFARAPASAQTPPLARLNFLFHAGDGSGRLFVDDMRGKIYVFRNGAFRPTPFLDIAALRSHHFVSKGGANSEVGVLSFAFHPDCARKGAPGYGKFYTLHSEDGGLEDDGRKPIFRGPKAKPDHYNLLTEWSVDPSDPDRIDPTSRREILRLAAHSDDHGGGQLGFDPNLSPRDADNRLLNIAVGDGGNTV